MTRPWDALVDGDYLNAYLINTDGWEKVPRIGQRILIGDATKHEYHLITEVIAGSQGILLEISPAAVARDNQGIWLD